MYKEMVFEDNNPRVGASNNQKERVNSQKRYHKAKKVGAGGKTIIRYSTTITV